MPTNPTEIRPDSNESGGGPTHMPPPPNKTVDRLKDRLHAAEAAPENAKKTNGTSGTNVRKPWTDLSFEELMASPPNEIETIFLEAKEAERQRKMLERDKKILENRVGLADEKSAYEKALPHVTAVAAVLVLLFVFRLWSMYEEPKASPTAEQIGAQINSGFKVPDAIVLAIANEMRKQKADLLTPAQFADLYEGINKAVVKQHSESLQEVKATIVEKTDPAAFANSVLEAMKDGRVTVGSLTVTPSKEKEHGRLVFNLKKTDLPPPLPPLLPEDEGK